MIGNQTAPTRDTQQSGLTSGGPTSILSSDISVEGNNTLVEGNDTSVEGNGTSIPRGHTVPYAQMPRPPILPPSHPPFHRGADSAHLPRDVLAGTQDTLIDPDPRVAWPDTYRDIPGWIYEVAEECSPRSDSNRADEVSNSEVVPILRTFDACGD